MSAAPRIDWYEWAGGRQAMLRFGPETGPVVVAAVPLFEEANRTRAFVVTILRSLAARGVASALPDLPGQGESLVAFNSLSLQQIGDGYAAAVTRVGAERRRVFALAVRSGALLDQRAAVAGRWQLSPQDGADLLRELARIGQAASGGALSGERAAGRVEIAGNLISPTLLGALENSEALQAASPVRIVRLTGDPRPADLHLDGAPLWRRSEPGNDPAFAELLAEDIARWVGSCGG